MWRGRILDNNYSCSSTTQIQNTHTKECKRMKHLTTNEFIHKAQQVHGNKYNYKRVIYENYHCVVEIECKKHGYFYQKPGVHLRNHGCPFCKSEKIHLEKNKGRIRFIEDAILKHGYKYNYDLVEYLTENDKVRIICPIHGIFAQTPKVHLGGSGCPYCAKDKRKQKK